MGFHWHEWLIFTERTHNGQALTRRILSLQHFYSLYSYILVRTETPVNTKTEWHYLLAVLICCSFSSIPGFHSFDSTKHPPSTQKDTHTQTLFPFPHVQMWSSTRVVYHCQCDLTFSPLCRHAESVLTALLLIFIFLQNFNYFVLHLSCLSIVSMPITTRSCVVLHPGSQISTFPFTNTCVPLCFPQGISMLCSPA